MKNNYVTDDILTHATAFASDTLGFQSLPSDIDAARVALTPSFAKAGDHVWIGTIRGYTGASVTFRETLMHALRAKAEAERLWDADNNGVLFYPAKEKYKAALESLEKIAPGASELLKLRQDR